NRTRRRAWILQHRNVLVESAYHRRRATTGHHLGDEEITHHDRHHEDRAERDTALGKRHDDQPHDIETARAGIDRRLDHALVDARHRIEDRHDHEYRELVHI